MSGTVKDPEFKACRTNSRRFFEEDRGTSVGVWQASPTTSQALDQARAGIGAGYGSVFVEHYEPHAFRDVRRLPRTLDLDALNELGHRLAGMSELERDIFAAALESSKFRPTMTEIINLTHCLDQFDFSPGHFSKQGFGGAMLETHASQHWEARERLRASDDPDNRAFADYVERLEAGLDLAKFGELAMAANGGILTSAGYLVPLSDSLPQRYTGPQDIPREHRLSENVKEPAAKPSLLGAVASLQETQSWRDTEEHASPVLEAPAGPEL